MKSKLKKYNRTVVFSGGSTRFVMYCGIYAAMVDHGIKPDVIIATCGASLAVAIIEAFPNVEEMKTYLMSEEFSTLFLHTKLSGQHRLVDLPAYCIKSCIKGKGAPILLDVFNRYLIDMPQDLGVLLPTLKNSDVNSIASVVIGSKLLYTAAEVGNSRDKVKTIQQVWMPNSVLSNDSFKDAVADLHFFDSNSAVASKSILMEDVSALQRARISMSDMFYIAPAYHNGDYYLGGAVNLIPVELALTLSDEVWIEKKEPYTWLEKGLVHSVFGYDANSRLTQVNANSVNYLDTTSVRKSLKGHYVSRKFNWNSLSIDMKIPSSTVQCLADINKQFEYGYQIVVQSL